MKPKDGCSRDAETRTWLVTARWTVGDGAVGRYSIAACRCCRLVRRPAVWRWHLRPRVVDAWASPPASSTPGRCLRTRRADCPPSCVDREMPRGPDRYRSGYGSSTLSPPVTVFQDPFPQAGQGGRWDRLSHGSSFRVARDYPLGAGRGGSGSDAETAGALSVASALEGACALLARGCGGGTQTARLLTKSLRSLPVVARLATQAFNRREQFELSGPHDLSGRSGILRWLDRGLWIISDQRGLGGTRP